VASLDGSSRRLPLPALDAPNDAVLVTIGELTAAVAVLRPPRTLRSAVLPARNRYIGLTGGPGPDCGFPSSVGSDAAASVEVARLATATLKGTTAPAHADSGGGGHTHHPLGGQVAGGLCGNSGSVGPARVVLRVRRRQPGRLRPPGNRRSRRRGACCTATSTRVGVALSHVSRWRVRAHSRNSASTRARSCSDIAFHTSGGGATGPVRPPIRAVGWTNPSPASRPLGAGPSWSSPRGMS
jgi:hypothetical protein